MVRAPEFVHVPWPATPPGSLCVTFHVFGDVISSPNPANRVCVEKKANTSETTSVLEP